MFNQLHRGVWTIIQGLSSPVKNVFRCLIPSGFRLTLKRFIGGTYHSIPNCIIQHNDGRQIRVGPDSIYWGIYCGHDFEPGASSVVRKLLSEGDVVVDIGANFGWYTTLFGTLIDNNFSIEQIALVSGSYIAFSIILLFLVKNKLNPIYI